MTIVVEFVGLPGVGKTTLSRTVAIELESRGVTVTEPVRTVDSRPGPQRILSKARFVSTGFLRAPATGITVTRAVLGTAQQSISDLARVLFNLHYVTGVVTGHRADDVCLLDQGPYQGLWSVGLRSAREWFEVFGRFDDVLPQFSPDFVVFVEADRQTIVDRLDARNDGDTRVRPSSTDFTRAVDGYQQLKTSVKTAENGPESITVGNESSDDLASNAIRVADAIRSLDASNL